MINLEIFSIMKFIKMAVKSVFLILFYGYSNWLIGQTQILPKFSVSASAGPATYWNKKISNVGFAHDYQYGQTQAIGLRTLFPISAFSFTIGLDYQYLFFKYRGVGPYSTEIPQIQTFYAYSGIQHAIETPLAISCPVRKLFSIGVSLTPRYLFNYKDLYFKEGVGFLNSSDEETSYANAEVWNKFQLMGGIVFSKSFVLHSNKQFDVHLSTNVSLTNPGGTDVYAAPLSMTNSKTRFVSSQLGFSYYLK
jgi:hypothetical protein